MHPRLGMCSVAVAALALAGATTAIQAQTKTQLAAPAVPFVLSGQTQSAGRGTVTSLITLADVGFGNGFRFANLGGRREIFVPMPQGAGIEPTELVLILDDISAHPARRSLEVLVNDRSISALALDGRNRGRVIRLPLNPAKTREGFLKLSFLYSGAATQDRCIDVRYVGDSLTIRPDSAVEFSLPSNRSLDVATTVALMPREAAVVLSGQPLAPSDIAGALTVARALAASGRHVSFHRGAAALADLAQSADQRRWARGIVVIGPPDEFAAYVEGLPVRVAGPPSDFGAIAAVRLAGFPALLVADSAAMGPGRLLESPFLPVTRGVTTASVGEIRKPKLPVDRINFDQLGLAPGMADVFGRAELSTTVNVRSLPPGTVISRLVLDILVAPDDTGEKAVVSVFVNERLLGSTVAASGEPTRLDLALPDGLVGSTANIRTVVQRRSSSGDCRFEPQGYPAQILGSSSLVLSKPETVQDFAALSAYWTGGVELWLPQAASERPLLFLGLLSNILNTLSPESAPITVKFAAAGVNPAPAASYIAVGNAAPADARPLVRFDLGRVIVLDREDQTLLDIGGFASGAVAQLVTANGHPGMWIKALAADGALPNPTELRIDRGDVAVFDEKGTSLAMSTARDTLVKIAYPDQVSWITVAARFRPWFIGTLWVLGTVLFLFILQHMYRRRVHSARD